MSIITRATNFTKGSSSALTLNKADLAAHSKIAGDSYFSNQANWRKVVAKYKSSEGLQRIAVHFDASQETPTGQFIPSDKALDVFEIEAITIFDFDEGWKTIMASELNPADYQIDFVTTYSS